MAGMSTAREVKNELEAAHREDAWFAGAGTRREDGVGFVVLVAVRPGVPRPEGVPPREIRGVRIDVIEASEGR